MSKHTITITETSAGKRTDKLVAEQFSRFPRAALQRLFASNNILLNKKSTRPGIKVRIGDVIEIDLSPLEFIVPDIELPVIYEDDDLLVVDKPSGVISHARGRFFDEPSVASFVRQVSAQTGERAGIVHRLDRATSGVMVCAKNAATLSWLQQQFSGRKVEKTYYAVISGHLPSKEGIIDMPIGRNPKKPQTFQVREDGKAAVTQYKVLQTSAKHDLVELMPKTGRTHQLRVHLKALGVPIVGDELYDGEPFSRLMLHALKLTIHDRQGELKSYNSPLPDTFKELFNA